MTNTTPTPDTNAPPLIVHPTLGYYLAWHCPQCRARETLGVPKSIERIGNGETLTVTCVAANADGVACGCVYSVQREAPRQAPLVQVARQMPNRQTRRAIEAARR